MNVYLDANPLLRSISGISRYVNCLFKEYQHMPEITVSLAFNSFKRPRSSMSHFPSIEHQQNIVNQRFPYKVIRQLTRPNILYECPYDFNTKKSNRPHIFHGTNFIHFPIREGKKVITIHDLAFLKFPESTSKRIYTHHSKWVPYSARKCDHIISISEHTKKDIVELFGISESKITTIPLASNKHFTKLKYELYNQVLQQYNLPERYILFVGTLEPRKNLIGLLKSYLIFRKNSTLSDKLVIVGAKGWKYSSIFQFIKENNLESDVIFTGYIDDDHLPAVYNGANLFVMPSIYEGFGIPILEAMGCGVPVIGSNVSSIPEVIDSYGVLISPNDYEGWASNIHRLLSNESLRNHYCKLSLERASHFSWEQTAKATKQVYQDVLNSNIPLKGLTNENSIGPRLSQSVRGRGAST